MSFLGKNVTLEVFAPNLTTPITYAQTTVVGAQEEFPDVAQWNIPGDAYEVVNGDFNVFADTITYKIDDTVYNQFARVPEFNGYVMTFDLGDTRISEIEVIRDDLAVPAENIFFNANSIFVDVDGIAFSNGDEAELSVTFIDLAADTLNDDIAMFTARLYSAAFGRDPDQEGLNFWIDVYDNVGRVGMSDYFLASPEFGDRFGDPVALSNDAYLNVLYNNILGRDGDAAGTAFWADVLTNDLASRSEVLSYFVDSEENVASTPELENLAVNSATGDWFLLT